MSEQLATSFHSNINDLISESDAAVPDRRLTGKTAKRVVLYPLGVQHDPFEFVRNLYGCPLTESKFKQRALVTLTPFRTCKTCHTEGDNAPWQQHWVDLTLQGTNRQDFQKLLDDYSNSQPVDLRCGDAMEERI